MQQAPTTFAAYERTKEKPENGGVSNICGHSKFGTRRNHHDIPLTIKEFYCLVYMHRIITLWRVLARQI